MSRVQVPAHLADLVRRFAADFGHVTDAWVRGGWHSAAEVAEWREVIRVDMSSECGVCVAIDPRPRDERVRAWCKTFRELAVRLEVKKCCP